MTTGRLIVWVDDWQMQCCGTPFAIGGEVAWTLHEDVDRQWLDSILGPDLAGTVTHAEEHHDRQPEGSPVVRARVRRIRAVSCRYAAGPTPKTLVAIPGSAVVTDIAEADGWYQETDPQQFNGYLVDMDPL